METLISEIRSEYHLPPYYPDTNIQSKINEGAAWLSSLNPGCDYETDLVYRGLLKNYVYYAFCGITHEFEANYKALILSWQLNTEV